MSSENPYAPPGTQVDNTAAYAAQNSGKYASRGKRLAGAMIDGFVMTPFVIGFMFATGAWQAAMAGHRSFGTGVLTVAFGFVVYLVLHGYLLAKNGQTIGKRLLGMRIVSVSDRQILPVWKILLLRYGVLAVLTLIPIVGSFLGLPNALFIFRDDHRCLHDHIAGTVVVEL